MEREIQLIQVNGTTRKTIIDLEKLTNDDAAWALTCAFLILTMQTGFAMLECGCVSMKNVSNIMIKNVVDVSLGGFSYWLFGYGLSFGHPSNWFMGLGGFCFTVSESTGKMGSDYSHYFFQFSFATTATTIVSGAVAERMKLHSYMVFSFLNTFVYCFPASWAWNAGESNWVAGASFHNQTGGFLYRLGFFDFAGTCVVHATGGSSALVAAWMLGPRKSRFEKPENYSMSSPVTALTGMFMLWWAWLGFNCGSTFGVSGDLWKITALVSVTTLNGSIGGGAIGLVLSMCRNRGKVLVDHVINSILGGLVAITGIAAVTTPAESLCIGAVGGAIAMTTPKIMDYLKIDDPVGAIPVHCFAAVWGTLVVGLFGRDDQSGTLRGANGLFHGGGWKLLGVQALGLMTCLTWSVTTTFIMLWIVRKVIGLRMSSEEEELGADWIEHQIRSMPEEPRKLEQALANLDEKYWSDFMKRLYSEMSGLDRPIVTPQGRHHRVFAIDVQPEVRVRPPPQTIHEEPTPIESVASDHPSAGFSNLHQRLISATKSSSGMLSSNESPTRTQPSPGGMYSNIFGGTAKQADQDRHSPNVMLVRPFNVASTDTRLPGQTSDSLRQLRGSTIDDQLL